jgi:molybdopterin converting factor small subunit
MDFKRYFGKIKSKAKKSEQTSETVDETEENVIQESESEIPKQEDHNVKNTLNFVDGKKDPHEYIRRYLMESKYKDWFNRNYPNHTIYDAVGLSISDYLNMKRELFPESSEIDEEESSNLEKPTAKNFKPTITHETKTSFDEFIDERILVSHNAFGDKEMKIKILEVSDEIAPLAGKFGERVKINKIIITIKHLQTQEIEEAEFDIEAIENELTEKRHYTSTNRWVPITDIKNGYLTNTRHTTLISDAAALDYLTF